MVVMKCPYLYSRFISLPVGDLLYFPETGRRLDKGLRKGEFHFIEEEVTPRSLIKCDSNALLKAFEVTCLSALLN